MSFSRCTEDYYRKFIELQEKLRKSEEERLRLEMKYNEMVQYTRDEEEAQHRKLQTQYQNFLEDDIKRHERNERIVKALERIENRSALLAAKTERFKLFRKQYTSYLKRMTGDVHYNPVELHCDHAEEYDHFKDNYYPASNLSTSPIHKKYNFESIRSKSPISERLSVVPENTKVNYPKYQNGDLYKHPTIQKVLNGNQNNLNDDLESLKSYLKPQTQFPSRERPPIVLNEDLFDSLSDSDLPERKSPTNDNKLERIIRWRPKFQLPRKNKFQFRRNRWSGPERVTKSYTSPKSKSPLASPSFRKRHLDVSPSPEIRRYEDNRRDFGYKPVSKVTNEEFRSSPSRNYSVSPSKHYQSEDLGYQLSNYPTLDVGTKINIEYTLYPKISDRSYFPSTSSSYPSYQRVSRSPSPGRNRVSWYDHYLGRCPPSSSQENLDYSRYNRDGGDGNRFVDDYISSKNKQDSILLNSEIRNTNYSDYKKYSPSYQTKRVDFVDNRQPDYKENDDHKIESKFDDLQKSDDHLKLDLPKFDDLPKSDVDETEDQVLSEVFQDEILEGRKQFCTTQDDIEDFQQTIINGDDKVSDIQKESQDSIELASIQPKDTDNKELYEEKHDSLEETKKENMLQQGNEIDLNLKEDAEIKEDCVEGFKSKDDLLDKEKPDYKENEAELGNEIKDEKENVQTEEKEDVNPEIDKEIISNKEEIIPNKEEIIPNKEEIIPNGIIKHVENKNDLEISEDQTTELNADETTEKQQLPPNENQPQDHNLTTEYKAEEYQPDDQQQNIQYDENGQPIQYGNYDQGNVQYDENGQPIGYEDGQYYPQYDENGQPVVQYDENGQPIVQYDENGQPLYQYDQYYQNQQYQEGQEQYQQEGYQEGEQYQEGQQQYEGETQNEQEYQEKQQEGQQQYQEGQQQYQEGQGEYQQDQQEYQKEQEQYHEEPQQYQGEPQHIQEEGNVEIQDGQNEKVTVDQKQSDDEKMKVLELLETDSESTKQETKTSNDSDFDLSK